MSKSNDTEEQQQVQAVSVSQAAGESLRRMAQHHGVVTAFYPVSLRPPEDMSCEHVSQAIQRGFGRMHCRLTAERPPKPCPDLSGVLPAGLEPGAAAGDGGVHPGRRLPVGGG
jgi:Flp pilus assembly protein TadD